MSTDKSKPKSRQDRPRVAKTGGTEKMPDGSVRVWSTVGATVPVPDSYGNIKFSFGHERYAKSSSQEELKRTAALIDEFNEAELDRRLTKYLRMFVRIQGEADSGTEESVQSRAKKRMKKKGKKKRGDDDDY